MAPRIHPVEVLGNESFTQRTLDETGDGARLHLFRTMAVHPALLRKFLPFGGKLLHGGLVSGRDRELAVLRIAHRAACQYEITKHEVIAALEGISDDEIRGIVPGADHSWPQRDAAILTVADELDEECTISDATWLRIRPHFSDAELIELILLIGNYRMLAGLLNGLQIELEADPGPAGFDR